MKENLTETKETVSERPFKSEFVIEEQISEATLRAYHVGFENNEFRLEALAQLIATVIPEFALGYHEGNKIPLTEMVDKLREAAKTIYDTDKYSKRGEFGELILHLLLRDFCGSIPLMSKIYFKDSINVAVHGFDGVHVVINGDERRLWLGESKMYTDGKEGVTKLAEDIKNHLEADYLRAEFNLISRKIPNDFQDREHWINLIHKNKSLDSILTGICIPVVCTYTSNMINGHKDATAEYFADFEKECKELKKYFEGKLISTNVDIVLMLLPVSDKPELVKKLDERLKNMQKI